MISLPQLDAVRAADAVRAHIVAGLAQVGCADVRADRAGRMIYSTDASLFQIDPLCAVVVRDIDEAIRVVQWCAGEGIAILPRGGGTSLNGQSVNEAVVLDLGAYCRQVISVDAERGRAWVEPGVVLDKFNADLAPLGWMFAPDPATSSHNAVGGCIGNNSAGAHSIIYGRTVENLYALDVVLADGTVHRLQEGACDRDPAQRRIAEAMRAVLWPLREEIRAQIREGVAKKDLARILAQIKASFLFQDESVLDLAMKLGRFEAGTPGGYRTLATVLGTYDSLTQQELRAAAAKYFDFDRIAVVYGVPGKRHEAAGKAQGKPAKLEKVETAKKAGKREPREKKAVAGKAAKKGGPGNKAKAGKKQKAGKKGRGA